MQLNANSLQIQLTEFRTLCWSVKIRGRVGHPFPAPRKSHVFPASLFPKNALPASRMRVIEPTSGQCLRDLHDWRIIGDQEPLGDD
jgi:hypothetical protein